jgi:SAM-dependent methyltransferase
MKPWHEQDSFWENMASHMFTDERTQQAVDDVDHVTELARLSAGAKILDLCCGPGRHALELARRGFTVTAVDRTRAYLDKARALAIGEGLTSVTFVLQDMRAYRQPAAFDLVVNLYTSFGYFDDPEDDRQVMRNIHESLRPGGSLVLDVLGKEVLAARFRPRDWSEDNGSLFLEERVLSRDWSWIDTRWIRIDAAGRTEFRLSHRLYSAAELQALATEAGFRSVRAYGSLDGAPYDHAAARLVLVAEK